MARARESKRKSVCNRKRKRKQKNAMKDEKQIHRIQIVCSRYYSITGQTITRISPPFPMY